MDDDYFEQGLSETKAKEKLKELGPNILASTSKKSIWSMIAEQFKDFLIVILLIASVASIMVGETVDGLMIIGIVILNAGLSIFQENKANNALEALKEMASSKAKVLRGGKLTEISASELVTGDVVYLEAGDYIPADIKLFEDASLQVNESSLTGESIPVTKDAGQETNEDVAIGDRVNMAFMGTIVTYGRGKGVVVDTGMNTEIGSISQMIQDTEDEKTPLQVKLAELGKLIGVACIIVCIIIFAIGLYREMPLIDIFMTSISLAVAAIPEGLPAIVTIVLALGMQRMTKKNAILKTLSAVETLGSTTVICSDKTGTLTQNKMTAVEVYNEDALGEILKAVLCNDAVFDKDKESIIGDPTEGALITLGKEKGYDKKELEKTYPRVNEIAFDSDRKLMSTIHKVTKEENDELTMYTKGAPDIVVAKSTHFMESGKTIALTKEKKEEILKINTNYANKALRVLAFGYKNIKEDNDSPKEDNIVFLGLIGLIDPPREEAKDAIALCKRAGIKVVMITGDHKITASAIAKDLNIIKDNNESIDGSELDQYDDDELVDIARNHKVYARVSPKHKVRIVQAIRKADNIVAMTGDGVNDAPALKQADIGIAMGKSGTDVAKEAADMILTDDNFESIVSAVEEGRTIYSNIRKFVGFLISCNIGELLLIFMAMLLGNDVPLLPIHLLWINVITDSLPAFALGVEPEEDGVMDIPPRNPSAPIMDKKMRVAVPIQSITLALAAYASFIYGQSIGSLATARTCVLITLSAGELLRAYSARSETKPLYKMDIFENKHLNYGALISLALLFVVVYIPFLQAIFHTVALGGFNLFIVMLLSLVPLFGGELGKRISKNI